MSQNSVIHTTIKLNNISFSGNRNNLTFGWVTGNEGPTFDPSCKENQCPFGGASSHLYYGLV